MTSWRRWGPGFVWPLKIRRFLIHKDFHPLHLPEAHEDLALAPSIELGSAMGTGGMLWHHDVVCVVVVLAEWIVIIFRFLLKVVVSHLGLLCIRWPAM